MLWEIAVGLKSDYRVLVFAEAEDNWDDFFHLDGSPTQWPRMPLVKPFVDPKRKKQKNRSDIEYIIWGAFVLNKRAYSVLHDALAPFGQFLELDCLGEVHYFYNVTHLIPIVDFANSEKMGNSITKPRFIEAAIPEGFCIFKDKLTAKGAIYTNDFTKSELEKLSLANGLTGLVFIPAGSF